MPEILFAMEAYQSRNLPLSAQRLVNMFWERQKPESKSQVPLFGVPGLTLFSTCGPTGPIRGLWNLDGLLYAVSGVSFYSIASNGTATLRGTGINGSAPVAMSDNGSQIIIINGAAAGQGFIYAPLTTTFTQIVSAGFYPADTVVFFDNYFILNRANTNQWFISNLLNGLTYSALDFASAEASSQSVVGITQNVQLLYIFSQDHIEIWYDAGTASFPFQRYTGGVIWRGCIAPQSIVKCDTAIYFLGDDLSFYEFRGSSPVRVSTHPIDDIIRNEPNPELASCFQYSIEGHKFINLTLPTSKRTLTYDTVTQVWHERKSWDAGNNDLGRWRGNCTVDCYGKTLIGDVFNNKIYSVDWSVNTEDGNTIPVLIHSAPVHADKQRVFVSRLELDMETGSGLVTNHDTAPQVMLRYSKDGGRTWSNLQPWRNLGKIGEYLKRLRWLRLGVAYQWIFEVTITDNVRRNFIAAHIDQEIGM